MRIVKVNEIGRRIGEDHPAAKLTDADVEIMLKLRAQGWSYNRLLVVFEVSKTTVHNICRGIKRTHLCAGHRTVHQEFRLWEGG